MDKMKKIGRSFVKRTLCFTVSPYTCLNSDTQTNNLLPIISGEGFIAVLEGIDSMLPQLEF